MFGVRTFRGGGIIPYERKNRTRDKRIWNAAIPGIAVVPFAQNQGRPATPLVAPGNRVREGMLIGQADGENSSPVHSPIPGIVREIVSIVLPGGDSSLAAVIALDGEFDRLGKEPRLYPWEHMSGTQIVDTIAAMGVVGMGGEAVPTRLKYLRATAAGVETLLINGVESEPYLTADFRLIVEKADQLVEGARIAGKALGVGRTVIAVADDHAAAAVTRAVREAGAPIRVTRLKQRYPQGDEKQLCRVITGKEIRSGGIATDIGVVVSNVATIYAIYEAVVLQKPVIERVVTVAGGAIRSQGNLKVRIGAPVADLIEECGGFTEQPARIVVGGPMMGTGIFDLSMPVTKSTRAILALSAHEVGDAPETACIQCGRCVRACPMGLEPTILYKYIDHHQHDRALEAGLMDCRECGACAYVCPAHIPLVQGLRVGKRTIENRRRAGTPAAGSVPEGAR